MLNSWMFSRPRAASDDSASYWPDTYFTVVPRSRQATQAGENIEAPFTAGFLEYAALVGHEQTHWIQANAFAYGRFLARIDHARSEIAESFFGMFRPEHVEILNQLRSGGRPVLDLATDDRAVRRPEFGRIGEILRDHWWSLALLRHEFETVDRRLGALEPSAYRYGLAMLYAQAGPNVSQIAMLPRKLLLELAREQAPTGGHAAALALSAFPELSSAAITECGALLNQYWTYSYAADSLQRRGDLAGARRLRRAHARSATFSAQVPLYGDAFRAFAQACPRLDLSEPAVQHTLAIVVYLALDGNYAPEARSSRPSWLAVSPPLRFLRLAKAVRRLGIVQNRILCDAPASRTLGYCDDLLEAAGLPARHHRLPRSPSRTGEPSPIDSLRTLVHDAYAASLHLRRALPAALIAPGETAIFRADALETGPLKAHKLARLPPLLSVGGRGVAVSISSARFAECALAGAYQRLLWQLMANADPMDFDGLPRDRTGRHAARSALSLLQQRTERLVRMQLRA